MNLLRVVFFFNILPVQQDGPSASFAAWVFPGLISGRNFFKLRQSTAFYSALTTIFRAQAVLSGTQFFFGLKKNEKSASGRRKKIYLKNKIFKKEVAEIFLLDEPNNFP